MHEVINTVLGFIVVYAANLLLPLLCISFLAGVLLRWVIFFTVRCEHSFAAEFEKRVHKHLAHEGDNKEDERNASFHQLTKKILDNCYYETFELKRKYRRRRMDQVTLLTDRLFLIQEGVERLIRDTLSQTKYLKKHGHQPKFLDISKFVFTSNPVFNRVFGIFPMGMFNDLLNILPGLFVIGGIFGTFLGVMSALPELSHMDIANPEITKKVLDAFLLKLAYSMSTSIMGIMFSVGMTVLNATMSPDGTYLGMVNKFTSSLEFLWNDTDTNEAAQVETSAAPDRRTVLFTNLAAKPGAVSAEVRPASTAPVGVAPNPPPSLPPNNPRIRELEMRLQTLERYKARSYEDKLNGIIAEELWAESNKRWLLEMQQIHDEIKTLKHAAPAAKAA